MCVVDADRRACLGYLRDAAERYGLRVEGYCLMTNHVHLVVEPREENSPADALKRTKRGRPLGSDAFVAKLEALLAHDNDYSDRNVTLGQSWTLIGHSTNKSVNVADLVFHQQGGSSYTWENAIGSGKVQATLISYEGGQATFTSTVFGHSALRESIGYFVRTHEVNGTLTLPSAGGTAPWKNFHWNNIRFIYDGQEKNIDDAYTAGWVFVDGTKKKIYWKDIDTQTDEEICDDVGICTQTLYPWQGYWIYSKHDNVKMVLRS